MPFTLLGSPNSGSRTKRKSVQWSSPYRYVFLEKIVPWLSYFKVTNIKIILIKKKWKMVKIERFCMYFTCIVVHRRRWCTTLMSQKSTSTSHSPTASPPSREKWRNSWRSLPRVAVPRIPGKFCRLSELWTRPTVRSRLLRLLYLLKKKAELSQFIFSKKYFVGKNIEPSWKSSWYKDYYSV